MAGKAMVPRGDLAFRGVFMGLTPRTGKSKGLEAICGFCALPAPFLPYAGERG